jgi:hypothetical protein
MTLVFERAGKVEVEVMVEEASVARTSEEMSRNVRARRADRFSDLSSLSMT